MNSTIMTQLKEYTAEAHHKTEQNAFPLALANDTLTINEYSHYLQKWYGYLQPLEDEISRRQEWKEWSFDFESRRKLPLLKQDLLALGLTIEDVDNLPICTNRPELSSFAEVLGCMYVLEGSTMGGQYIVKKLKLIFPQHMQHNGLFLNSYGSELRSKWAEFAELVQAYSSKQPSHKAILLTAKRTFECFDEWLVR